MLYVMQTKAYKIIVCFHVYNTNNNKLHLIMKGSNTMTNNNNNEINNEITMSNESIESKIVRLNEKFSQELFQEIKTDVTSKNRETKTSIISAFLTTGTEDKTTMFRNFINNQDYEALSLRPDIKNGGYKLSKSNRQIDFADLELAYSEAHDGEGTLANSKLYHGMVARFLNNIMIYNASAIGDGKASKHSENGGKTVSIPAFNSEASKEYKEIDFTSTSICGMKDQLDTIVKEILPEDLKIQMVKADVRALLSACKSEKRMKFKGVNETQLLGKIFDCMEIRMNGKAYEIKSVANCHKA